jgi:hypothetical protein
MKQPVPEVGKIYKFYDDGKIRISRQYDATVLRILNKEEAKNSMFPLYCNENTDWEETTIIQDNESIAGTISLYDKWQEAIKNHTQDEGNCTMVIQDKDGNFRELEVGEPWLFAKDTDYFIECSIFGYDESNIWFARTINGNWFSMNIQNGWQGGQLDVDNHLTRELEEYISKNK